MLDKRAQNNRTATRDRGKTFCSRNDNLFIAFHRPRKRRSIVISKLTCCSEKTETKKQDEDKNRKGKEERHISTKGAQTTRIHVAMARPFFRQESKLKFAKPS